MEKRALTGAYQTLQVVTKKKTPEYAPSFVDEPQEDLTPAMMKSIESVQFIITNNRGGHFENSEINETQ